MDTQITITRPKTDSVVSATSDLPFPGSLPGQVMYRKDTRAQAHEDLFNQYDLEAVATMSIPESTEADRKVAAEQEQRKSTLNARLSLDDKHMLARRLSSITTEVPQGLEVVVEPVPSALTRQEKAEAFEQKSQEVKSYIQKIKEAGLAHGPTFMALTSLAMVIWSVADSIPFEAYVVDASIFTMGFIVQSFQGMLNKLKKEDTAEYPEAAEPSNPAPVQILSFSQRAKNKFSSGFDFVKSKAAYIATIVALGSSIFTIVAEFEKTSDSRMIEAAQWIDNIEAGLEGILAAGFLTTKLAINSIYKKRAQAEARKRGASKEGNIMTMRERTELQVLPDRRPSIAVGPKVIMVANPLVADAQLTIETGAETQSNTPTPEKGDTPEKRGSSEEATPELRAVKSLDFKVAEVEADPTI